MSAENGSRAPETRAPDAGRSILGTIGHSTRPLEELVEMLTAFGATLLVDVRTVPRSRHNPHFNRDTLPGALSPHGIEYVHEPALGGLRKPRPDSPNGAWRNASFRGYADHMQTSVFEEALSGLIARVRSDTGDATRPVVMCAEAVPWRCHRSLIADALTARGLDVVHLLGPSQQRAHALTSFARVADGRVTYPLTLIT